MSRQFCVCVADFSQRLLQFSLATSFNYTLPSIFPSEWANSTLHDAILNTGEKYKVLLQLNLRRDPSVDSINSVSDFEFTDKDFQIRCCEPGTPLCPCGAGGDCALAQETDSNYECTGEASDAVPASKANQCRLTNEGEPGYECNADDRSCAGEGSRCIGSFCYPSTCFREGESELLTSLLNCRCDSGMCGPDRTTGVQLVCDTERGDICRMPPISEVVCNPDALAPPPIDETADASDDDSEPAAAEPAPAPMMAGEPAMETEPAPASAAGGTRIILDPNSPAYDVCAAHPEGRDTPYGCTSEAQCEPCTPGDLKCVCKADSSCNEIDEGILECASNNRCYHKTECVGCICAANGPTCPDGYICLAGVCDLMPPLASEPSDSGEVSDTESASSPPAKSAAASHQATLFSVMAFCFVTFLMSF